MLSLSVLSVSGFEKADRIVEDVVRPMNERRLWIDVENGLVQPQIVAVVGPEHQAMTGEADRAAVGVFGRMHDADSGHAAS